MRPGAAVALVALGVAHLVQAQGRLSSLPIAAVALGTAGFLQMVVGMDMLVEWRRSTALWGVAVLVATAGAWGTVGLSPGGCQSERRGEVAAAEGAPEPFSPERALKRHNADHAKHDPLEQLKEALARPAEVDPGAPGGAPPCSRA